MIYFAIALGGACGALSRFAVGQWVAGLGYAHLNLATFSVNVLGSLLIGLAYVGAERLNLSEPVRLSISVGFLGAFTTFSAFSIELLSEIQEGHLARAAIYASLTLFLCLISCFTGIELARSAFD